MSYIWPGLDFLIKANRTRLKKGTPQYARPYPFGIYPPPLGYDCGNFHIECMEQIAAAHEQICGRELRGGRLKLNAIQIRACIYAVRVTIGLRRQQRYDYRKSDSKTKAVLHITKKDIRTLRTRSRPVIRTLERHMKRANRALLLSFSGRQYNEMMANWRSHLRWMRHYLAYFRRRPLVPGYRKVQRYRIDTLVTMAEKGLQNQGYVPPSPKVLRHLMRLYSRSAGRGNQSIWTVALLLENPLNYTRTLRLAEFVKRKIKSPLERLQAV